MKERNVHVVQMKPKLLWAMMMTFLIMGGFLAAVFWIALQIFGVSGMPMIIGIIGFVSIMVIIQWAISPTLIKKMSRAKECKDPKIKKMVHELAEKADIPKPKVYLVKNDTPNAFAFGRSQKSSAIALHTGLINNLNEEELRGVIAHEVSHIKHKDTTVMTIASALPMILFYIVFFGSMMSGGRRRGGGFLGAWIGGMIAQFIGSLVVMYLSRVREYYADTSSAYITENPPALASALQKITSYEPQPNKAIKRKTQSPNNTLKNFYIAEPSKRSAAGSKAKSSFTEIFMSHPLPEKRIKNLEEIDV